MTNKIAKYTNYNAYILERHAAHKVDEKRLEEAVEKLTKMYKNPYIRFMWVSNSNKAMCVVYSDTKKNERFTRLVSFDVVEEIINEYNNKLKGK